MLLMACMLTGSYAAEKSDTRLSKKITYYSGYVRLSDAVAEISKLSGIKIAAGISRNDWQVRDMPVVVCANDIEVGKLLNLMTDAYYLALKKTDVDGETLYRFYRPKVYQDLLSKYNDNIANLEMQRELYRWKLFNWMASLSDEEVEKVYNEANAVSPDCTRAYGPGTSRLGYDEIVSYSRLIKAIGDEGMSRLLNGEEIILSVKQGGDIGKMVQDFVLQKKEIFDVTGNYDANREVETIDSNGVRRKVRTIYEPVTPDLENAQIAFKLDASNGLSLNSSVSAGPFHSMGFLGDVLSFSSALDRLSISKSTKQQSAPNNTKQPLTAADSNRPVFPKHPEQPTFEMRFLKAATNDKLEPDKKYQFNKMDNKTILLADVLTEISKTTGRSILADDYMDHKDTLPDAYKDIFNGKKSLVDVKWSLGIKRVFKWYISEENKLIDLKAWSWADRYNNLVPKASFADWLSSARSSGLELYDFLAMWRLTDGQELDWICFVKDLHRFVSAKYMTHAALLNILAAMSVDDLNTAYGSGIYLANIANLDTEQLKELFNSLPAESRPEVDISKLYMKLVEDTKQDYDGLERHTYTVEIHGGKEPVKFSFNVAFPIYSPDREKELIKEVTAERMKIKTVQ
ncbi:MAG: hypothetical protein ABFD46_05385 [Armatimonadota bacterium]